MLASDDTLPPAPIDTDIVRRVLAALHTLSDQLPASDLPRGHGARVTTVEAVQSWLLGLFSNPASVTKALDGETGA